VVDGDRLGDDPDDVAGFDRVALLDLGSELPLLLEVTSPISPSSPT